MIYICTFFFRLFSIIGYYRILSRSLLTIYFIYSSVYMLIPNSYQIYTSKYLLEHGLF